MTTTSEAIDADRALKSKQRTVWGDLGDYAAVVRDLISALGETLVDACGIQSGQQVLDIAAGTGNASIPAALTGAHVIASDLTPALLEIGRTEAAARGADLDWREADAEALPFGDDEFDVVMSCLGVMFAPHHQVAADELIRVCRPGGVVGLLSWTPEGFIGQLFATLRPYAPAPPPGVQPPPLWGSEEHVRDLFGERLTDVTVERRQLRVDHFRRPEEFRDYFKANYGPVAAVYGAIAGDPERVAELDRALAELAHRFDVREPGADAAVTRWEYLLVTARKGQTV